MRETEGGKYKPDIHPECDLHKGYLKLREKQFLGYGGIHEGNYIVAAVDFYWLLPEERI